MMDNKAMITTRRLGMTLFLLILAAGDARAGGDWIYAVRPGDSLIEIADTYLAKPQRWQKLQELNQVADPRRLVPGSRLRIPVDWLRREAAVADVVRVQGDARKIAGENVRILAAGDKLAVGDTVRTGSGANLTLRFVDGSRLLVAQNSALKLAQMQLLGRTGMARTVVNLNGGEVETRVSRQPAPGAKYEIQTEALNLGVRGTEFRVGVAEGGLTRGEVLGGRVMAAGSGTPVDLDAGFGTVAAPGKAPLSPVRLLAAPDLSALSARIERLPLRLGWKEMPEAVRYRAQVFADGALDQLVLEGVFPSPTAKWADLPDGKYVLRVRGVAANGLEGLDAARDFVVKARPEAPFVTEPRDGKKAYGPRTTFRWARVDGAGSYHLQLAHTPDFTKPAVDIGNIVKTEHGLALEPGQYYWRIASVRNDGDHGPYSDAQGFTQRRIPESPAVAPPHTDDKTLAFAWKAGEPGQKFQIQLARDKAFANIVADQQTTEPRFSMARPEGGVYYMRIKTIDDDGFAGPFGAPQQIEVPAAFPAWVLLLAIPLALGL